MTEVPETRRVLLIGSDRFDTMMDSFRRALSDHYEVRVADPFTTMSAARRVLSQPLASKLEGVAQTPASEGGDRGVEDTPQRASCHACSSTRHLLADTARWSA